MRRSSASARDTPARRLSNAMVVAPLLVGNALMLVLCLLGFYVLSATRAYVGGESHWSKGRSQAIQQLRAYAADGEAVHLDRLDAALQVPLGDREARLEMDKPAPDLARVRAAFVQGGNAPEDVDGMIRLYRWFGRTTLMAESVAAWARGDELILALQQMGRRLREIAHERPADRAAQVAAVLSGLDALEAELPTLERTYSRALGEASRATFLLLAVFVAVSTLALTLTAWFMIHRGLVRQARHERELEDANQRWSMAAQSDGLGLFEWQLSGDMATLDARACAVYGLDCGPEGRVLPRRDIRALIEPDDAPALQAELDRIAGGGELLRHRYRIRVKGETRHLELTGIAQGSPADGKRRMFGIVKDVSAKVRSDRLEVDKAAAERSAAARSEFLSRLSHELRTPLNAVLGFSDLLLIAAPAPPGSPGEGPLSERQRQRIELIRDAGRHLLHLVDDVLDISGIDAGKFSVARVPTPLAPVIAAAAALVSPEQEEFGIALDVAGAGEGVTALADPQRLGQVLANLFSNACKYNRLGGRVTVRVEAGAPQAGQVRISIADEGAGLAEEEIAQLFQPFKRLPGAAAQRRGTGLGLTLVRLLVEQMGGEVTVASRRGEGSVFSVVLQQA